MHESTDLDRARIIRVGGLPTTAPERLAVDLGGVVSFERYQAGIEDLIARGLLSWNDALDSLVLHARRGRRGIGAARQLLEAR